MKHIALKLLLVFSYLLILTSTFALEWKSLTPSARRSSTMIVDCHNQRVILFGGTSERLNGKWYNDVWEIPLNNPLGFFWLPLSVSGNSPSPRCQHSAVYDQDNQRLLIFGGDAEGNLVNEVWALNLTLGHERWERLNPGGTPPVPRYDQYAIYHPTRNSLIIFGGDAGDYQWRNDVWELKLDSMLWREILVSGNRPAPRGGGGEFFDSANNRMIIFGGSAWENYYNEVWALDLTLGNEHWTQLNPTGSIPIERSDFAYGYDPIRNKFYVFGGSNWPRGLLFNDLYLLDISTLTWTQLFPSGELPIERRNSVGVYDFFNDNFFVFGGDLGGDAYLGETYFAHIPTTDTPEWSSQPIVNIFPSILVSPISSGSIVIRYLLPKVSNTEIKILDVNGRVVRNLFSGKINSPSGVLLWDCKNENGQVVSSGTYFCILETGNTRISEKFVIAK